jgi:hypothetical protein
MQIIDDYKHRSLRYSTIKGSKHINNSSIILGETLSNVRINIESTKISYDESSTNSTTSHIMNHHPHIFPPSNWDQKQENKLYQRKEQVFEEKGSTK